MFRRLAKIYVRPAVREDLHRIVEIDGLTTGRPTDEDFWVEYHRCSRYEILVAERLGDVIGMLLAGKDLDRWSIYKLGVHPGFKRLGAGRALIDKLKSSCAAGKRSIIKALVHECMTPACCFFRDLGFTSQLVRNVYPERDDEPARDAYEFTWTVSVDSRLDRYTNHARGVS